MRLPILLVLVHLSIVAHELHEFTLDFVDAINGLCYEQCQATQGHHQQAAHRWSRAAHDRTCPGRAGTNDAGLLLK